MVNINWYQHETINLNATCTDKYLQQYQSLCRIINVCQIVKETLDCSEVTNVYYDIL